LAPLRTEAGRLGGDVEPEGSVEKFRRSSTNLRAPIAAPQSGPVRRPRRPVADKPGDWAVRTDWRARTQLFASQIIL